MPTLLSLVDAADPYAPGLIGNDLWAGPVLSLLSLRSFTRVALFCMPDDNERAEETARVISERYGVSAVVVALPGDSLPAAHRFVCDWRAKNPADESVACVNAGPIALRGVWWMLADEEGADLSLIEVTRPDYVTAEPATARDVSPPSPARRSFIIAREPAVAYRVETDPDHYELNWRGRGAGAARAPVPTLDHALRQLGLCGSDAAFRRAVETAATLAPHKAPVLLGGETGSGKGALAKLIHALSGRPENRWVALNCAAVPEQLAESILFGHKKGSFTGASTDQAGKFEAADKGTLFLDEIGELPMTLQAKLLKILEDGVVEAVGARQGKSVDVRVIAATNRDLRAAVTAKTFREDLYYRLSFARIEMPPLRERRGDIPQLALRLVAKINASLRNPRRLTPAAIQRLEQHSWPGNIRDLENVIGRSLLLSTRTELGAADLLFDAAPSASDPLQQLPEPREGFSLESFLSDARRQLILRALETSGGNQSAAARLLGLSPQAVHKFLREQTADQPVFRAAASRNAGNSEATLN